MKQTFFALGGDERQKAMVLELKNRGYTVHTAALEPNDHLTEKKQAVLYSADIVLLPLPVEKPTGILNAPFYEKKLPLEGLPALMHPAQTVYGGKIPRFLMEKGKDLLWADYFENPDFILKNAYLTAEGALQRTMELLPRTVRGSRVLILGYGRIAGFLAEILHHLGAEVCVAARKSEERTKAEIMGCRTCSLKNMQGILRSCDVVYNTIPYPVLKAGLLEFLPRYCLCMDLASPPGGIDLAYAESLGLKTLWASGLPGKTAPESAGHAILDTVFEMIETGEVFS